MTRGSGQRGFSMIEMMVVVSVALILFAFGVPALNNIMRAQRIAGDVREIVGSIALAKMRAASDFTQARVYVDLSANTFQVEVCKTKQPATFPTCGSWNLTEDGAQALSTGVRMGYGSLGSPPTGTQAAIGQAAQCGSTANTACITFNSRGIPIDPSNNNPSGEGAIYITNGDSVYGATVSALGAVRTWRSTAKTAGWVQI